jgi:1-aminocyclopropane-1-carboxylate deaminase
MTTATLPERPPSPIQEIRCTKLDANGLRLLVKRDDLLAWSENSALCGNKWRKLKYNLAAAKAQNQSHLLSFGGAYSNHLAAVAEAAQVLGFQATGVVRGEETLPLNPTLEFVQNCGMRLIYVSREAYRHKSEPDFLPSIGIDPDGVFVLPEGGTNAAALRGCRELAEEIQAQTDADFIAVACGTGGTLAGIVSGLKGSCKALGFSVLKGDFHQKKWPPFCSKRVRNLAVTGRWKLFITSADMPNGNRNCWTLCAISRTNTALRSIRFIPAK